ncbi:MAG: high mobility group box domain-containing protein, partial [Benniella sp.]
RPVNSFMIYRTEKLHELPRDTAAKLSKILGARWKAEPPEVKERYAELAKEAERRHAEQYPNYKFMPAK